MMQSTAVSEAKQAILSEQAAYAQENYKKLLESHLDEESILRIKEDKIEVSLSQWLAKYDGDIGDKQNIKEEIQAEFSIFSYILFNSIKNLYIVDTMQTRQNWKGLTDKLMSKKVFSMP